jgi:[ribosomal protein S18]-alanine N-acetyltransferase
MPRLRGVGKVYDAWDSTHAAEVSVRFEFRKMTDEEAQEIAGWRYVLPYDFYDSVSDPDDLAELLDSHRRGDDYFSALDEKGTLVGLFQFKRDGKVVGVGLSLRPDLTGKGLGHGFLVAGLGFARRSFCPEVFRLSVATFQREGHQSVRGRRLRTRADLPPRD